MSQMFTNSKNFHLYILYIDIDISLHYILKFERAKYFKPNILRLVKGIDQEQDEATHPQYIIHILVQEMGMDTPIREH
jgi:hypothetical protein